MPRPFSTVAIGRRKGSASRATKRMAMCRPNTSSERPAPSSTSCVSTRPRAPSCTSTIAPALMTQATMRSPSSRLRSFCGRWMRRTLPVEGAPPGATAVFRSVNGLLQSLHDADGLVERPRADRLLDTLLVVGAQLGDVDARLGVQLVQRDRPEVLL